MTHLPLSDSFRNVCHRLSWQAAFFAAAIGQPIYAQTHHVTAPERVTRAVGVYEWTGELDKPTAARLVPLTLYINGHLEDAGVYLARPVPFALETGDLYSVERAGRSEGLFALDHVRRVAPTTDPSAESAAAFLAFGKYAPPKPEPKPPVLHTSAKNPVIVSSADSGQPHFSNKPQADTGSPSTKTTDTDKTPASSSTTGPTLHRPSDTSQQDSKTSTDSQSNSSQSNSSKSTQDSTTSSSSDPDRPTLQRRADTSQDSQTSTDSQSSGDSKNGTTSSTNNSGGPTLHRPMDSSQQDSKTSNGSDSSTANNGSKSSKDDDIDRPTLRKRDPSQDAQRHDTVHSGQSGVTGPEVSLNDDPDRPHMRHGAPPGASITGELLGLPADMHQATAVSDAATREPHVFAREWEYPTERAEAMLKLEAIARPLIKAYVTTNQLTLGVPPVPPPPAATSNAAPAASQGSSATPAADDNESGPKLRRGVPKAYQAPTPATPAPKAATASTAAAKAKASKATGKTKVQPAPAEPLTLAQEEIVPYTLSYGGLPTFVYTAQTDVRTGGPVYLTVVAQRLISGDMQVALSSVTDATHLNRTPWLRPVDAVDPDASHRASLLFELRAQSTRQFALYQLVSAKAEQTFITGLMP